MVVNARVLFCTATEFLNSCQDETEKVSTFCVILLKNTDISG
jgi:hypothetical protein